MLCIMNGKKRPNWVKVEQYGLQTAAMIETEYPWYHKSPSIHSLLCHSREVMAHKPLPPGYYTEGSQESYNKRDRMTRLMHARKCSRRANIQDIFQTHLCYGDPLVSASMRSSKDIEYTNLPEYLDLLDDIYTISSSSSTEIANMNSDDEDSDDDNYDTDAEMVDVTSDNEDEDEDTL